MKHLLITCFFIGLALLSSLQGCKKDDDPGLTEAERRTAILTSGTWTPTSITVNGVEVLPELFQNFTITFTNTGYTTTGTTPVWTRNGTWSFTDNTGITIKREDDRMVTITEITNTSLKVTMDWDQTTYARTQSMEGTHVFVFSK